MSDFLFIVNRCKLYLYEIIDKKRAKLFKIRGHSYNELNLASPESSFERLAIHLLDSLNYPDFSSCKFTTIYNDVETEVLKFLSDNFLPCKDWQIHKLANILPILLLKLDEIKIGEKKVVNFDDNYFLVDIKETGEYRVRQVENKGEIKLEINDIPKALFAKYSFIVGEKDIESLKQQLKEKEKEVNDLKSELRYIRNELETEKEKGQSLKDRLNDKNNEIKKLKKYFARGNQPCTHCGCFYDVIENRVKSNASFSYISKDWQCPSCGIKKENFEE